MKKITPKTKLSEIMENEKAVEILFESGLSCIGCPMAMQETIEEGCIGHGMSKKDIDKLIERLNKRK
jgi:hybrid cluster-associated redox disulfide protein